MTCRHAPKHKSYDILGAFEIPRRTISDETQIESSKRSSGPMSGNPGPELYGCQAKGKSMGGHCQAGMHLNSTDDVVPQLSVQTSPQGKPMQDANRADILPVVGKLRCIVKNQNSGICGSESLARGLKVSSKNSLFGDAVV